MVSGVLKAVLRNNSCCPFDECIVDRNVLVFGDAISTLAIRSVSDLLSFALLG